MKSADVLKYFISGMLPGKGRVGSSLTPASTFALGAEA
jgi:hypothetical protein